VQKKPDHGSRRGWLHNWLCSQQGRKRGGELACKLADLAAPATPTAKSLRSGDRKRENVSAKKNVCFPVLEWNMEEPGTSGTISFADFCINTCKHLDNRLCSCRQILLPYKGGEHN
jgi:hypothetical protein